MSKLTYLLIQCQPGKHICPIGVGIRRTYGHAEFDPALNAHTFRCSQELWDSGLDRDIAENAHRSLCKWVVKAEVEPDLESPEGKLAQEVDALKAQIAQLEAELEPYRMAGDELEATAMRAKARQPAVNGLPPLDSAEQIELAREDIETAPETPVDPTKPDLNLHPKTLEKLVREANEKGAEIVIEGERTKVKLRAALEAYYAKAA